jgi:hypothetical protein
MELHIGVDGKRKLIHSLLTTAANVHDRTVLGELLHGDERRVYGDLAYQGPERVVRERAPNAKDFTNRRYRYRGTVDEVERGKNRTNLSMWAMIDAGISTRRHDGQPPEVMHPTPIVAGALLRVRKSAMGHAQQGTAVPVDKVDLDQGRSRGHLFASLPTKTVDKTVHRHDLPELAARRATRAFEEIEPAGLRLHRCLGAHPADDLFRIRQKGENGGRRSCDMDLALD